MTPAELKARVQRDYPGAQWHNECAGFAYYVCRVTGKVVRAYASATAARLASTIVSTDPDAAPAGAFHFWSYPGWVDGVYADWGHVAPAIGSGWAAMTDPEDSEADWGNDLGVSHVASWTANRRGIVTYLGWSYTYGANTATITTDSGAGENARPWPFTTPPILEEDDMLMIRVIDGDTAHLCAIAPGVFRHFIGSDPHDLIMRLERAQDDWQDVPITDLPALLRTNGCDLAIWDLRDGAGASVGTGKGGQFVVLDPLSGEIGPGRLWSAANAIRAELRGITQPKVDPAPLVAAINAAISAGRDYDVAAIAKAVNDEAAKRLAK